MTSSCQNKVQETVIPKVFKVVAINILMKMVTLEAFESLEVLKNKTRLT